LSPGPVTFHAGITLALLEPSTNSVLLSLC